MGDYDDVLKKLAMAKLQQKPEEVDVEKPVFNISDPNKPMKLRSQGIPDAEPIDYAKLNNPGIDSKSEQIPAAIEKAKPMEKSQQSSNEVYKSNDIPKPPENQHEKELSDKAVAGMVASLQEIPDHDVNSKHATLDDMMENGDLSDYEKHKLIEWAKEDAARIKANKENYY